MAHQCNDAGGLAVGRNLVTAMGRVAPEHDYVITLPPGRGYEDICRNIPRCRFHVYRRARGLTKRWYDETFTLPKVIAAFQPQVILGLGDRGLMKPPCPQAVYFHRPPLVYPPKHYVKESLKNKLLFGYHTRFLRKCLRQTQLLICQTAVVEKRSRERFGYDGEVLVAPPAVPTFTSGPELQDMPRALAPHADKYKLLCMARYYPHKNHAAIVECFRRYRRELDGVLAVLTIAPDQSPRAARFLRSISSLGLGDQIISVGQVDRADVPGYYMHCQGFLMPTLLEAFSLTYLEAMHFNLPIITSDLDFAHAACGPGALYADPWDPGSIKDAILRLKDDAALRDELVRNGRQQLAAITGSWDDVAVNILGRLVAVARGG